MIAFDGRSGAGKSTLASVVASRLNATIVPGDDFFAAELSDAEWERRTAEQRANDAIDWRHLRRDTLEPCARVCPRVGLRSTSSRAPDRMARTRC